MKVIVKDDSIQINEIGKQDELYRLLAWLDDGLSQSDNETIMALNEAFQKGVEEYKNRPLDHEKIAGILGCTYTKLDGPIVGAAGRANLTKIYKQRKGK
jgi:hypothetical protein